MPETENKVLMQGNEACVEGAIACGMRFFAGYPITPSTEIAERCAVRLPMVGGHFIQMEDEIAGMAAVIGASIAGVKAMTATSGPGFSLKQENIGYAAEAEVPCVIVDVQRSGPSTGLPTSPSQGDVMQSRWGTHGDHPVIVLSPSSVLETYTLIIRAFNLSEKYRVPVIFLMDEMIGHLREGVVLPEHPDVTGRALPDPARKQHYLPYRVEPGELVPRIAPMGTGFRYNITGLAHGEDGFPTESSGVAGALMRRLMDKIERNRDDICEADERDTEDAEAAVVCFGGTARSAMAAVLKCRGKGIRAGMFRPVTIWPFPEKQFRALTKRVKKIVVAEHNCGQMLLEVQRLAGSDVRVGFIGRSDGTVITPDEICGAIGEVL